MLAEYEADGQTFKLLQAGLEYFGTAHIGYHDLIRPLLDGVTCCGYTAAQESQTHYQDATAAQGIGIADGRLRVSA